LSGGQLRQRWAKQLNITCLTYNATQTFWEFRLKLCVSTRNYAHPGVCANTRQASGEGKHQT